MLETSSRSTTIIELVEGQAAVHICGAEKTLLANLMSERRVTWRRLLYAECTAIFTLRLRLFGRQLCQRRFTKHILYIYIYFKVIIN